MRIDTVFHRQLRQYIGLVFRDNALVATTLPKPNRNKAACAAVAVKRDIQP